MIYGLILGIIGTLFGEANNVITKNKMNKHHHLKLGVIGAFFSSLIFIIALIYKYFFTDLEIYFNSESIPLLTLRAFLEVTQAYFTILAIKYSDRSTFSIIRILTIPLLVIADIILGYQFSFYSYLGIGIILLSFIIFNTKVKSINFKGWYYVLFTAVNAVFTLSLFKYSITHYGNSLEIDQFIMGFSILIFFIIYNFKVNKCCAVKLIIKEKIFLLQGLFIGLLGLFISYAYIYLNAAEATAIIRAGEMLWAIIAGVLFFKEDNFIKKILFAVCICVGLGVMII